MPRAGFPCPLAQNRTISKESAWRQKVSASEAMVQSICNTLAGDSVIHIPGAAAIGREPWRLEQLSGASKALYKLCSVGSGNVREMSGAPCEPFRPTLQPWAGFAQFIA